VLAGKGDGTFRRVAYFGVPGSNGSLSPLFAAGPLASGGKPDFLVISNSFGSQPTATVLQNITK